MKRRSGCLEWPNCECPKCNSYRAYLSVQPPTLGGMGAPEAKDAVAVAPAPVRKREFLGLACGRCDLCFEGRQVWCRNKS